MKQVTFFYLEGCPYCRQAIKWMQEAECESPECKKVDVRWVEERREAAYARGFDYYFVPTYYVDGVKVHEGVASKSVVESVYKKALSE